MKKTILLTFLALILSLALVSASDVSINPSNPEYNDDLVCDVTGSGTYDFYWYKNGNQYEADMNTQSSTLDASNTKAGETWTCKVYVPENGFTDSYYLDADSVTIQESDDGTEGYVQITPENPYTEDTLRCDVMDSDATFEFYWYGGTHMEYSEKNVEYSTLPSSYTEEGQTWKCKVYIPENGFTDSYYFGMDEVTVQQSEILQPGDFEGLDYNFPPVLDEIEDIEIQVGESVYVLAHATDLDNDNLEFTWDFANTDAQLSNQFNVPVNAEGAFSQMEWQTQTGDQGQYTLTVYVTDGEFLVSETFTITVLEEIPQNHAPTVDVPDFEVHEGEDLWVLVYQYAQDPDGDWLTYDFEYTMDATDMWSFFYWQTDRDDAGIHEVTVTVSDGEFEAQDTFTITVTDNEAPILDEIDDQEFDEEDFIEITATARDPENDPLEYTWDLGSLEDKGAIFNDNVFSWQTDCDDAGLYPLTVSVTDGEYSDSLTFYIKVNDVCSTDGEPLASNYEGHKLYVNEVRAMDAGSLASAYEFEAGTQVTVSGDYEVNGNVLTSKNTDNEVNVLIELHNKNSFDARDLQVTFILAGEEYLTTFPDLDRSEKTSQMYKIEIPNNLETGKYALQVVIENDDLYNEEFINLEIESLGDAVTNENTQPKSFWQAFLAIFS